MYDLNPKAVFVHERVFENAKAVARMERMLDAMGIPPASVPRVNAGDIEEIVAIADATNEVAAEQVLKGGHGRVRMGHLKQAHDPVMIFNTFVWDESRRTPVQGDYTHPKARQLASLFAGVGSNFAYSRREPNCVPGQVNCQGGWGIHSIAGCVHKCDYCGQGFITHLMLDLEDFCADLGRMFAERPQQKLYRYDLFSDILAFEPEYGCSEVVGECFAQTDDKYLLLYTRSANIDHLLDLPYKEHSLINWTLSMDTVCRVVERDSPSLAERIEAMRRCQEAGYVVRAGFSPIIPVADWRQETTEMLELLFSQVQPEVLRCWTLAMMDAAEFETMFDVGMMDQDFVRRMREEASNLDGLHGAPFPLDVRAEIYEHYLREIDRISPETPVALCTEHPKLWDQLGHLVKMKRDRMFCCCGSTSVPGGRAECTS